MTDKTIIMIRERFTESLAKDAASAVMVIGIIGIGWTLGSSAMQWFGFILASVVLVGHGMDAMKKRKYTLDEARELIDAMIAERDQ